MTSMGRESEMFGEALKRWRAKRGLDQMCADSWRWQQANPNGYDS